jgi:prepilin-type N-terminal cleavage/methylation domain-containing protein
MKRKGFTLIELLISIVLMIILLSAVTMVFIHTTETVTVSQARSQVYTEARRAADMLEEDLLACFPFTGAQEFTMDNGTGSLQGNVAAEPRPGGGGHATNAADKLSFIATTLVGTTHQSARITYFLLPGHKALDSVGNVEEGDHDFGRTQQTPQFPQGRPLYTLIRRVLILNPATSRYDQRPVDQLGKPVPDMELCRFITSFNLEYYSSNLGYSQLDPSPFQSTVTPGGKNDPLGNGLGENDGEGSEEAVPIRIPAIRITLTIVEDRTARQERMIQKIIAIPMG